MTETAFYKRLRTIAARAGDHDQQSIAARLGVSNAAVTGWKKGTPPTWQSILKAARAYGEEPYHLLQIAVPEFRATGHPFLRATGR
jgi:transcriptional regulator with XRE-family HTH domain